MSLLLLLITLMHPCLIKILINFFSCSTTTKLENLTQPKWGLSVTVFSLTLFKPESTLMERLRKKLQLLEWNWTFLNGYWIHLCSCCGVDSTRRLACAVMLIFCANPVLNWSSFVKQSGVKWWHGNNTLLQQLFLFSKAAQHGLTPFVACSWGWGLCTFWGLWCH